MIVLGYGYNFIYRHRGPCYVPGNLIRILSIIDVIKTEDVSDLIRGLAQEGDNWKATKKEVREPGEVQKRVRLVRVYKDIQNLQNVHAGRHLYCFSQQGRRWCLLVETLDILEDGCPSHYGEVEVTVCLSTWLGGLPSSKAHKGWSYLLCLTSSTTAFVGSWNPSMHPHPSRHGLFLPKISTRRGPHYETSTRRNQEILLRTSSRTIASPLGEDGFLREIALASPTERSAEDHFVKISSTIWPAPDAPKELPHLVKTIFGQSRAIDACSDDGSVVYSVKPVDVCNTREVDVRKIVLILFDPCVRHEGLKSMKLYGLADTDESVYTKPAIECGGYHPQSANSNSRDGGRYEILSQVIARETDESNGSSEYPKGNEGRDCG